MAESFRKRRYIPQHTQGGRLQRDMRLDNLRGVLIILVVIGHFLLPLKQSETRLILGIFYLIYSFHMPCFVMLSGFYAKSLYDREGYFRWGKIIQILWLYVVYEVIVFLTEGMAYGPTTPIPNFFKESGAPWYLLALFWWYCTVPVFNRFRGKRSSLYITIAMFIAVAFLKYFIQVGSILSLDRTITFMPFFYAGFFTSQIQLDRYLVSRYRRYVDMAAIFFALLILLGTKDLLYRYNLVVYGTDYRRYLPALYGHLWLVELIWCGVAMSLSLGLAGIMLNRRMTIITSLGRNTLPIYIAHRPIRDIMEYAGFYTMIDPFSRINVIALIIFSLILTIVLNNPLLSELFKRLRGVFDPLLEKHNAL